MDTIADMLAPGTVVWLAGWHTVLDVTVDGGRIDDRLVITTSGGMFVLDRETPVRTLDALPCRAAATTGAC